MIVINSEKHIIKSWCNNLEDGALEQAKALANLPFIFRQVCLMPDTHKGYGMPIGGVIACKDTIIPNAVGVDIGCGMCAIKTNFQYVPNTDTLKSIMKAARNTIPMGMKNHKHPQDLGMAHVDHTEVVNSVMGRAEYALGTLGGGNHFIELQVDQGGFLWIMIHSGSRNFGMQVAKYYNTLAERLNEQWYTGYPKELAWLPISTDEGKNYITDMNFALEFALKNRQKMMYKMMDIVKNCFKKYDGHDVSYPWDMYNVYHNYAVIENHFGKNVWVHRKGATSARAGEIGIIPGSQGTSSYIVEGKGNAESFTSCSHGAGRKMGRKQAQKKLNLEAEQKMLDDQGIIHSVRNRSDLDESPGAYKDIDVVMKEQTDLVDIVHKLKPIAVMKG